MTKVLVTESSLNDIAEAIRGKNGSANTYKPGQMAAAITALPTGITPTGTVQISENGTVDVTQYASANVSVQPNLQSKTATQNGTVTPDQGYDGLSSVVVNVSGGGGLAVKLMDHGQVSNTSDYMTATFENAVDFSAYDCLLICLFRESKTYYGATNAVGEFDIAGGAYTSSIKQTYSMAITTTQISCTSYRGSYVNLYVDVYGINLS